MLFSTPSLRPGAWTLPIAGNLAGPCIYTPVYLHLRRNCSATFWVAMDQCPYEYRPASVFRFAWPHRDRRRRNLRENMLSTLDADTFDAIAGTLLEL